MHVKQRFPNFFSGFTPSEHDVYSLQELKNLDFVKRWMSNKTFHQFSISVGRRELAYLMCELDGGKEFWVIAYLKDFEGFELPNWEKKK